MASCWPAMAAKRLVFTDATGNHITKPTLYRAFKRATASIGRLDARFYDLRHSYTVATLRSGDDIKTVQGNLGYVTATFTQDVYGHVTMQMKEVSAAHIEKQFPWDKTKVQSSP